MSATTIERYGLSITLDVYGGDPREPFADPASVEVVSATYRDIGDWMSWLADWSDRELDQFWPVDPPRVGHDVCVNVLAWLSETRMADLTERAVA